MNNPREISKGVWLSLNNLFWEEVGVENMSGKSCSFVVEHMTVPSKLCPSYSSQVTGKDPRFEPLKATLGKISPGVQRSRTTDGT